MEPSKLDKLTPREIEILRLVDQGYLSAHIGRALNISPHTVDHHAKSAIKKLGVGDRRTAARMLNGSSANPFSGDVAKAWLR